MSYLLNLYMQKPYIIGVTGGSGVGKTTFIHRLFHQFSHDEVCFLSMDNYYKKRDEQVRDCNEQYNFDLPTSFRREDFFNDLTTLANGGSVSLMEYTFNNPLVVAKEIVYRSAPVIIVEGIFVFYFEEISEMLDLKIYLDASEHLKLIRRIKRDAEERNYPLDDVLYRYQYHVHPTYEQFISPMKAKADIIINNNHRLDGALDLIVPFLKEKIAQNKGV